MIKSVARTVLAISEPFLLYRWSIFNILKKKGKDAPDFLMLENVDRLLKSPSVQRGRDFAVMLSSLAQLGYAVEWRVINAADYGMPQRRRRTFILGYKKGTKLYNLIKKENNIKNWINKNGVIAKAFPIKKDFIVIDSIGKLEKNLEKLSKNFSCHKPSKSPFENSGVMIDYQVYTAKTIFDYEGERMILRDIINTGKNQAIPVEFIIKEIDKKKWIELKGAKNEERKSKDGFTYTYSEGSMAFPDSLDNPSRTIVTGEGGASPSRFKHVIEMKPGEWRRLMPFELELLNMFPKDWTKFMKDGKEECSKNRSCYTTEKRMDSEDETDMSLFERDALAYKIMAGNKSLSYEDACKEAIKIIKIDKEEEREDNLIS